jgi:hypothetical protein
VVLMPSWRLRRRISTGVSEMSMLLQQAFQQSMPLRHWNWMVAQPSSSSASPGFRRAGFADEIGKFVHGVISVKSNCWIPAPAHNLPGQGPTQQMSIAVV